MEITLYLGFDAEKIIQHYTTKEVMDKYEDA
jgi:hypothetical protein